MTAAAARPAAEEPELVRRTALPIFTKSLVDGWRSLVGWSVGFTAALSLYLPIFPSMSGNSQMQDLIDSLPTELTRTLNYQHIDTGAGYTQSTFFGLMGFLLSASPPSAGERQRSAATRNQASWNSPSRTPSPG